MADARAVLRAAGLDDALTAAEPLGGGMVNEVWRVTWADGTRRVLKHEAGAPPGLFRAEAEGLRALADPGGLTVPEVHHVGERLLILEELAPLSNPAPDFWADTARALAGLHAVPGPAHGWHHPGWLGRLPQDNTWTDDGHAFFATRRLLRYLPEPRVEAALTPADRAGVERLCARLPLFVPPTPPALTHGDLWQGNVVATAGGAPAFIDPAVSFTWPEVDLSMYAASARPEDADRFFGAYRELRPLTEGWRERLEILFLREVLSTLAHEETTWAVPHLRQVIARYA